MFRSTSIARTVIAPALIAAFASTAVVQPASAARTAKVGIGLASKTTTKSYLAAQIRKQARQQGVKLSERQVQAAAGRALGNLKNKDKDPLKGIIHLKFKKFTICISWGADKGHCKGGKAKRASLNKLSK